MNLLAELIASFLRYALGAAFGALVLHKIVSADLAARIMDSWPIAVATWVVTFVVPAVWIWLKNRKRIATILAALALPPDTDPKDAKAEIKTELKATNPGLSKVP